MYKSSARISLHLLPGFEFLKIKSVLYDTDNTPKNVTAYSNTVSIKIKLIVEVQLVQSISSPEDRQSDISLSQV